LWGESWALNCPFPQGQRTKPARGWDMEARNETPALPSKIKRSVCPKAQRARLAFPGGYAPFVQIAAGAPATDRFRYTSDCDDGDAVARSPNKPPYLVRIACANRSFLAKGRRHHDRVNNIRRNYAGAAGPELTKPIYRKRHGLLGLLMDRSEQARSGKRHEFSSSIASNSASASRSLGRPAARLARISWARLRQRHCVPKICNSIAPADRSS
jgi:hypothetical protein